MAKLKILRSLVLQSVVILLAIQLLTSPAFANEVANMIANPGFENVSSWTVRSAYGNGTVNLHDSTEAHSGNYAARLTAINKNLLCSSECRDNITAEAQYSVTNSPMLTNLLNSQSDFSAWWYVAPSTLPAYSLRFGLEFSDGSSVEYWYGHSDLTNRAFDLGPIPSGGSWFQMNRNLTMDIRGIVSNPATTRISKVWFGALGGSYNNTSYGETAWLDDVRLDFIGVPVAAFTQDVTEGMAPLNITFDAGHSYEPAGFTGSILKYSWTFGDGSPTYATLRPTTNHTFARPGSYKVSLVVSDTFNGTSLSASMTIKANSPPGPIGPVTLAVLVAGGLGLTGAWAVIASKRRHRRKRMRESRRF